jgi:hypothetical protein
MKFSEFLMNEASDYSQYLDNDGRVVDPDTVKTVDSNELYLFGSNDGELYRQQLRPIEINLKKKLDKGIYDSALAIKAWRHFADTCAKKYVQEFGGKFSVKDRDLCAVAFAYDWEAENL